MGEGRRGTECPGCSPDTDSGPVTIACVEEALLAWYRMNKRDLPWRETSDPYAILVSEVMLQQTQASRVIPYYEQWLQRWPTVEELAAAPVAEAIRAWQGLGYNRRAANLHRSARVIAEHGWPDDLTELPGVGRYTADAVARHAFGRPVLPVDVNVRRVLERTAHRFSPEASQALMDLGARICIARVPRCCECPLAARCPSRGCRFEPARKQGPFEGSFRQRRSQTLRLVAERPRSVQEVDTAVVRSLESDGLVVSSGGLVRLP